MAALGEPHRFFLACRLRHRPYSVGELVEDTGWPQPLVSHHLGILSHAGLVVADRDGRRRLYRLADPVDPSLRALLGLLRHPPVPGRTPPEEAIPDRLDELIAPSRAQPDRGIDDYLL
jgi:DNA-binding transcriptional ArsR family regulator